MKKQKLEAKPRHQSKLKMEVMELKRNLNKTQKGSIIRMKVKLKI